MEGAVLRESHLRVQLANRLALKHGVSLVRQILANKESPLHGPGMTTEEIYRFTLQQTPPSEYYNPHTRANKPFPPMPNLARKGLKRVQSPAPPNPEHPVRSKVFLKKSILQYLVGTQELAKARVERVLDVPTPIKSSKKGNKGLVTRNEEGKYKHIAWVWKAAEPTIIKPPQAINTENTIQLFDAVRAEEVGERDVGVGDDFSHLSRKRQKARRQEIRREARKLKEVMRQQKMAMRQQKARQQKEEAVADGEFRRLQAARAVKKSSEERDTHKLKEPMSQQKEGSVTGVEFRRLQMTRAKKSPQEQDWEDWRSAVRKPFTRNRK